MSTFARVTEALGLTRSVPTADVYPSDHAYPVPPRRTAAAGTLGQALSIDAVYRAFFVLQTAVEQLTLDAWRHAAPLPDAPALLRRPNVDESLSAFLAETVTSLAGRGNFYWRKLHGADGSVVNLTVLNPLEVAPVIDQRTGRASYSYRGQSLTRRDITHGKLVRITGQAEGLGPVQAAQRSLAGALAMREYADGWFDGAGVPNGVLKTDQHLTAEQAQLYKAQWMAGQSFADGPAVLGGGLDYSPLLLKPSEIQWIEAQKFSITGIARLFGLPASMMLAAVDGSSDTYQNQEQADLGFLRYTLMGYLRPIEEAFTDLLPRGQSARFNVEGLLRSDTKTRYEAHALAITNKFLTVDEVRAIEGRGPLPASAQPAPAPAAAPETAEDPADV